LYSIISGTEQKFKIRCSSHFFVDTFCWFWDWAGRYITRWHRVTIAWSDRWPCRISVSPDWPGPNPREWTIRHWWSEVMASRRTTMSIFWGRDKFAVVASEALGITSQTASVWPAQSENQFKIDT